MWILAAFLSAVFTSTAALLSKHGLKKTDSVLCTTLRTLVVFAITFLFTAATGNLKGFENIDRRCFLFMVLSGISTAFCSIFYFKAISLGTVNKVLPIEKSSVILTLLFAIFYFSDKRHLGLKVTGIFIILLGLPFLLEKDEEDKGTESSFYICAFLSMIFAALNTIFSKLGVTGIESNLATFINTVLEVIVTCIYAAARGKFKGLKSIPAKEHLYIILSGLATSGSWLTYYYAVKMGTLSIVIPLNKLSVPMVAVYSHFFLKEPISRRMGTALFLMTSGMMLVAALS